MNQLIKLSPFLLSQFTHQLSNSNCSRLVRHTKPFAGKNLKSQMLLSRTVSTWWRTKCQSRVNFLKSLMIRLPAPLVHYNRKSYPANSVANNSITVDQKRTNSRTPITKQSKDLLLRKTKTNSIAKLKANTAAYSNTMYLNTAYPINSRKQEN